MSREQLMAQQRARVLAMRARKLAERKAAEAAKKLAAKASTTKGPLKDGNKYAPTLRESRDSKKGPVADRQEYGKTLKENKASKQGPVRDGKEYAKNTLSQNTTRPSTKAQPSTSTKTGGTKPVQKTNVQKGAQAVTTRSTNKPVNSKNDDDPGKMSEHFAAPQLNQTTKKPTFKLIKGVLHILKGGKYVPAKKSR